MGDRAGAGLAAGGRGSLAPDPMTVSHPLPLRWGDTEGAAGAITFGSAETPSTHVEGPSLHIAGSRELTISETACSVTGTLYQRVPPASGPHAAFWTLLLFARGPVSWGQGARRAQFSSGPASWGSGGDGGCRLDRVNWGLLGLVPFGGAAIGPSAGYGPPAPTPEDRQLAAITWPFQPGGESGFYPE